MLVPSSADAYGRMGRLHEMAHVALTPTDGMEQAAAAGIKPEYINVAEDLRLHKYLSTYDFNLEASIPEKELKHMIEGYILQKDLKLLTLYSIASHFLPEQEKITDVVWLERMENGDNDKFLNAFEQIRNTAVAMLSYGLSFQQSMEVAKYLQSIFELGDIISAAMGDNDDGREPEIPLDQLINRSLEDGEWGEMKIETPPLTKHLPERRMNRQIAPKEYGDMLMFPTRLDDDGKIFGGIKRTAAAAVLIDVSGSMALSVEDIKNIVKTVPGALVATYCGAGNEGTLKIVAKNGSMTENLEPDYGGNTVDGPALRWLGKQKGPRYWVSDGGVIGGSSSNNPFGANLVRDCINICRKFDIERIPDTESMINFFKGR